MTKPCNHKTTQYTWRPATEAERITLHSDEVVLARRCVTCREQLGMGASNDTPAAVQVEARAARRRGRTTKAERVGLLTHGLGDDFPATRSAKLRTAYEAGWLAREIATHDDREERDADAWPWDATRPVAGQHEEWGGPDRPKPTWCPEHRTIRVDMGLVAVTLDVGAEPEQGVELEVAPLPAGSHDHVDCPCDHPPGEMGPCGGCNCGDDVPVEHGSSEWVASADAVERAGAPHAPDLSTVTLREGDASCHGGPGWYYTIDDYPDEGSCGAFPTRGEAAGHARKAGYLVEDEPSTPRAAPADEPPITIALDDHGATPADDALIAAIAHAPPREPPTGRERAEIERILSDVPSDAPAEVAP